MADPTSNPELNPPCELQTAHGSLQLPAFFPDGTRGVVRTVGSEDLEACGVQGIVVNAYHLGAEPGSGVITAADGVHRFMGWSGPILTDSGGFQIYSLLRENPKAGSVSKDGFRYRQPGQKEKRNLTAEKSVRLQFQFGADILVCLDHCTHPDAPEQEQRASVDHTVRWAKEGKRVLDELADRAGRRPLLFAVVQGGNNEALRRECAERLAEIGFDGYGFGGWPIRGDGELVETVELVASLVPKGAPLWGLGIGKPQHVVRAAKWGYTLFDCVLPTRDARQGRLYACPEGCAPHHGDLAYVYIADEKHTRSFEPVDASCGCPVCHRYTRAYLHHLFQIGDALGHRLATMHNLAWYAQLMEGLRGHGG